MFGLYVVCLTSLAIGRCFDSFFFSSKLEDVAGSDEVALSRKFGNEEYVRDFVSCAPLLTKLR